MGSREIFGASVSDRMDLVYDLICQLDKYYRVKQMMFPLTVIINGQLRYLNAITRGRAVYTATPLDSFVIQHERTYPWEHEFKWLQDYFKHGMFNYSGE